LAGRLGRGFQGARAWQCLSTSYRYYEHLSN